MSKKNKIDFFGMKKGPTYFSGKSNINFLNSKKKISAKPSPIKKNLKIKPFGFLNKGKVIPKQKYINWDYKKIKKKFPGINPYGDADMDGSMNYRDCKPFNASKDGKILEKLKGFFKRKEKPFRVETKGEKILRETGKKFKAIKKKALLEKIAKTGERIRKAQEKLTYRRVPVKDKKTGRVIGYRKEFIGKKKVSPKVLKAIALAGIPVRITKDKVSRKGEAVHARAGRPSGSYKYSIPSKGPVPIHVYKKWLTEQKAKARIKALAQVQAIQAGKQPPLDGEERFIEEEEEEVPVEEISTEEVEEAPQPRQVQQAEVEPVQQPSQVAGGPTKDNILQAPNIARGELRNVQSVPIVQLSEKPQANPRGEMYTQIDPMSGRPIIHRRISEKFATGEAL